MTPILFAILAIFAVIAYRRGAHSARLEMSRRFEERPDLSIEAQHASHYAREIDLVLLDELLQHVGSELQVSSRKLLPTDRFDVELKPVRGWEFDSGNGMLFIELGERYRKAGLQLNLSSIVTLDDYIRAMVRVYSVDS